MIRIVPIPETDYYAVWDTVRDRFLTDRSGEQAWDDLDDIDITDYEMLERISLLWPRRA